MTLEERVAKLERSRRRWMGAAVVAVLAAVSMVLMAATAPQAQDLTVRSLNVVDAQGKTTVRIAGSGVMIFGDSRRDGPMVSLIAITKERGGGSQLFMHNSRGEMGVNIVAQDGRGRVNTR